MSNRPNEFPRGTQELALLRQQNRCASCGTKITALGDAGRASHQFGEGARAHHVQHIKFGGQDNLANCVILCESCHYSVHEGGLYRFGTVTGGRSDYTHYYG